MTNPSPNVEMWVDFGIMTFYVAGVLHDEITFAESCFPGFNDYAIFNISIDNSISSQQLIQIRDTIQHGLRYKVKYIELEQEGK